MYDWKGDELKQTATQQQAEGRKKGNPQKRW
jgi:hypothetical protein